MSELFLKLVNMSITASWLILAVVVLRLVLKKAPKWVNCVLWALVAVRLICPFSFESKLSLVPDTDVNGAVSAMVSQMGKGEMRDALEEIGGVDGPAVSFETEYPTVVFPNSGTDEVAPIRAVDIFSAVWLAGMIVLLLHAVVSYLRLRRRVSAAVPAGNNVWLCDAVESPFILGIFRPRIYLPSYISEGDVQHVLAHERAHLQRCDHWWKPIGYVLLSVYWFNPLIWVAYILLCRDIELACDEKVIKRPDTDRKAYSEALLACSVKRSAITACPLAFGEVSVRGRIKSVLNYKKPAFWIILVALVACIVAAVCFLSDPLKPTVHDVADQKGYKITAVTRYVTMPISVPVDVLGEDIYSNEGHVYEPDEVVVYQSDTTTVYLEHVRYLEQYGEEQLYFDFRFAYEIPDEGTVRTLFTPNIENGETVSSTLGSSVPDKTAWDSITTYPDGARLYGVNQGVEVSVAIQTDVVRGAQDYIAFTLGSLTDITYETGKANHEDDIRYLSEDQAETAPFGQSYRVVETTYVDGSYSFVMTPENAPTFRVDESKNLIEIYVEGSDRTDTYLGALEPTELTEENFDEWFHPITSETGMWENGLSAAKIRRGNQAAWELTQNGDGSHCRLLLQKNGDLYLTYGLLETDQGEKRIRWLLKLEPYEEEPGSIGSTGGVDEPIAVVVTSEVEQTNPALETAIDYVTKRMETFNESWKTIAPGNSTTRGKITALECVSTTAMENIRLDLYRLECRMLLNGNPAAVEVGGMSHEEIDGEIWLTEWESSGQPYILHYSAMEDGRIDWKTICMTSTEEIGVIYAENKDMETMLGLDQYTIAIHKLYELYLRKEHLEEEIADRSVVGAMLAAVEALMTERLPATICKTDEAGRIHPVFGKLNAWASINGKQSCSAILNHTYQVVDRIETSDTLITLEFAVNGVDWGLTFYDETDTLSVYTGGAEYLLRATPKQEDVFLLPLGSLIRRWYDEAEYMALGGYDGKTIVIPNTGQSYLEAAQDWCIAYEGLHLRASSGSKECYTYVSCRVEPAESATDLRREQGEINENTYAFYAYTAFVPENEQALHWSMAGNTGAYEGNDPSVPKDAYEYTRCGYITREEDGWHGTIVGTGW